MKKILLTLLLGFFIKSTYAQFSIIQDGDGETSFQLLKSNAVAINAEKESIGFSISPKKYTNKDKFFWTITSSANSEKGSSNIFKGGEFQFSGKSGANLIFDMSDTANANFYYQFFGIECLYSRYNVFDSTKAFDDQIDQNSNFGFRVNYGWNFENILIDKPILKILGEFTMGVSLSGGLKDNSDIIEQDEIITTSNSYFQNSVSRTVSKTDNAYDINSLKTNMGFGRLNFDFGKHIFKKRVLANLHLTYALDQGLKPSFNPAFGFFITGIGASLDAVAGIQIQTKDWINARESNKNRWERTSIVLTAGFPFN